VKNLGFAYLQGQRAIESPKTRTEKSKSVARHKFLNKSKISPAKGAFTSFIILLFKKENVFLFVKNLQNNF
jgi:hypothetical protein